MSIADLSEKECTSCCSCYNVCLSSSIDMVENSYGFMYPKVNEDKCTSCMLCEKACPVYKQQIPATPLKYFGCTNKNEKIRLKSSSGGIFHGLSKSVIDSGGVVFGVKLDTKNKPIFTYVDNVHDLLALLGSKYSHADYHKYFIDVKKFLGKGKKVLFSGAPCQVAGLKAFLRKDYENLITVDFICHGMASPKVYGDYINLLESKNKSKIIRVSFRDKKTGWSNFSFSVDFQNGKTFSELMSENFYMRGFLRSFYEKESCHYCKFKNFTSGSDIVLCDFWGADILYPQHVDEKGLSGVIINTHKGMTLFKSVDGEFEVFETDYVSIKSGNQYVAKSSMPNVKKELFFEDYFKYGLEHAMDKYLSDDMITKLKKRVKFYLKKLAISVLLLRISDLYDALQIAEALQLSL